MCWLNMIIDQDQHKEESLSWGGGGGVALLEGILHTSSWLERPQRTCRCICESVNGSSSVLKSVMTVNYRWPPLSWFWRAAAAAYRRSIAPAVVTVADLRTLAVEGYTRIHKVCEWPCLWYNAGDAPPSLKRTLTSTELDRFICTSAWVLL